MNQLIQDFLNTKSLSANTKTAYRSDLQQFMGLCKGQVADGKLALYQAFLSDLRPTAQRRKLSVVNQFLYFLYLEGQVDRFYKLVPPSHQKVTGSRPILEDLSLLSQPSSHKNGQDIARWMAYLGLTPSELSQLRRSDVEEVFRIVTVYRGKEKRVLTLPEELLPFVQPSQESDYLFGKNGQPYSRQWFFLQLSAYTKSIGKREWTAQKLREQFILRQLQAGHSMEEVAKQLGLKTVMSLEKYRKWI